MSETTTLDAPAVPAAETPEVKCSGACAAVNSLMPEGHQPGYEERAIARYRENAAKVREAHAAYIASPDDAPNEDLWRACRNLVVDFASGPIPFALVLHVKLIESLAQHLAGIFKNPRFVVGEFIPTAQFWGVLEQLAKIDNPPSSPAQRTESVELLNAQDVPRCQIGAIWGISLAEVDQEIAKPGSVIQPGTLPPKLQKRLDEQRQRALQDVPNGMVLSMFAHQLRPYFSR